MTCTAETIAELDLLLCFDPSTSQTGIKIHASAKPSVIAAARGLFAKGLITREDGGYLTPLGLTAAEHAQGLFDLLDVPVKT